MLRRLHLALSDDFAPRFITYYGMACLAAAENDARLAVQSLRSAVRIGAAAHGLFAEDSDAMGVFNASIQQAYCMDYDALPATAPVVPVHTKAEGGPVLLAACNGLYFDRYGPAFLASAAPHSGLRCHVHVVNPTATTEEVFQRACKGALAEFSLGIDQWQEDATYYACKRFIVAGEVMDRFRADLIITDIDTEVTADALNVLSHAEDADAGLFERSISSSPKEICQCSLSFFRYTAAGRHFLEVLGAFLEARLREFGVWTQDQSALFMVSRLWRQEPDFPTWAGVPQLRWLDLSSKLGDRMEEFCPSQKATLAEKQELRRHDRLNSQRVTVDAEGRPSFRSGKLES